MKTQVVIIGAGPAGLLLGQLLYRSGIDAVIIEKHTAERVRGRIRAGVLERSTVELLDEAGVGDRLHREGLVHRGFSMLIDSRRHRIDLQRLCGRSVTVYGQTEITGDLMAARADAGLPTCYQAQDTAIGGFEGSRPFVTYRHEGRTHRIDCDFIAGCDGHHGVCRTSVPASAITLYQQRYPSRWLGLLSETPPVSDELLYVNSPRGFALCSMRSRTRSRYYLQVPAGDTVESWSDEAFWQELRLRLDDDARSRLVTGPALEKSVVALRSVVAEPLRFGRLFLAGDAAHIVPPTGAKGLNLAASDIRLLAAALLEYYREGSEAGLRHYSERCLRRVWMASRFSWWFTMLTHRSADDGMIGARLQAAELDYLLNSDAGLTTIAENYAGLPVDDRRR